MRRLMLLAAVFFACHTVFAGEVYRWKDSQGHLHFSDRPPVNRTTTNAEKLNVVPNSTMDTPSGLTEGAAAFRAERAAEAARSNTRNLAASLPNSITIRDYDLTTDLNVNGRTVKVAGRINSGPACQNLSLNFRLRDENGNQAHAKTTVEYSGSGSTLYEATDKLHRSHPTINWQIVDSQAHCK